MTFRGAPNPMRQTGQERASHPLAIRLEEGRGATPAGTPTSRPLSASPRVLQIRALSRISAGVSQLTEGARTRESVSGATHWWRYSPSNLVWKKRGRLRRGVRGGLHWVFKCACFRDNIHLAWKEECVGEMCVRCTHVERRQWPPEAHQVWGQVALPPVRGDRGN